jgi:hypothetical protein
LFDITHGGTDPAALLSLTVNADSDSLTTGNKKCFDSANWASYAKTDRVTAAGITYTAAGGTFAVDSAGKYFILCTVMLSVGSSSERTMTVKRGATTVYSAPFYVHVNTDPQEKTTCLIVDAEAGDSFTFVVTDPQGTFDAGTAISMFKVDFSNESTPSALIAEDFTVNTWEIDTLSSQYNRVVEEVPVSLGTRGPTSLRGRTTSVSVTLGDKTKK